MKTLIAFIIATVIVGCCRKDEAPIEETVVHSSVTLQSEPTKPVKPLEERKCYSYVSGDTNWKVKILRKYDKNTYKGMFIDDQKQFDEDVVEFHDEKIADFEPYNCDAFEDLKSLSVQMVKEKPASVDAQ